jgi:hypothetical protein
MKILPSAISLAMSSSSNNVAFSSLTMLIHLLYQNHIRSFKVEGFRAPGTIIAAVINYFNSKSKYKLCPK